MSADENTPVIPAVDVEVTENIVSTSVQSVEADSVTASMSAIASSKSETLNATASAIGLARVEGDASVRLSATPLVYTKGNLSFFQSYGSAFIAGQDVSIRQGGSAMTVAKTVSFHQAGTGVTVASGVTVSKGFVGLLLARNVDVSDDSRVLFTGRSVLYLAAALLGGFGLIAVAIAVAGTKAMASKPSLPAWRRDR